MMRPVLMVVLVFVLLFDTLQLAWGHHVLGRPAYRFSEDSSTPPALFVETQIGQYMVNVMVYPAFPKAGQESRVKLYATHLDTQQPLSEPVTFLVRDDRWWGDPREEELGVQKADDFIYRQIVVFSENADYILTAKFTALGEPYVVDVPITIGPPSHQWSLLAAAGGIVTVLGWVAWKKRSRRRRGG